MAALINKTSEDFKVGQIVRCLNPALFLIPLNKYLIDRVGVVEKVYPETRPDPAYSRYTNMVVVRWQTRNGQGKERVLTMYPNTIEVVQGDIMQQALNAMGKAIKYPTTVTVRMPAKTKETP